MPEGINDLTNLAVSASGEVDSLLIEKFTGKVHEQYIKGENLQAYFYVNEVVGTNMVSNKYLGDTEVQALVPGEDPNPTPTEADKNALVVDTSVIARNAVAQLHDVQNDINDQKGKLAKNQTKQLKKLEDYMLLQQMLFGVINNFESQDAGVDGGRVAPRVSGHGYSVKLTISDAQSIDPNNMLASIEYVLEKQLIQENELEDMAVIVPWAIFNVLSDAERLVNKDYELASGMVISGFMLKRWNVPIIPSNRFPVAAHAGSDHHLLSKPANSYRYDVTAAMLTAVAVVFAPDALLVGRTIALQGDIFWDKKSKSYFIDSWFAEGAIPDRWEANGAVFAGGSENTDITARAARKAVVTKALS
jgi:hypothetical protein